MKIVHITQFFHPERGYQENFLAKHNVKRGLDTYIISSTDLSAWGEVTNSIEWQTIADKEFSQKYGVTIFRLRVLFQYSKRLFMVGLRKKLSQINPDIVFIHGVSLPFVFTALNWSKKNNKIIIVDDHMVPAGVKNRYSGLFHKLFRPLFNGYLKLLKIHVDRWIGVAEEAAEFMRIQFGIKDEVVVIPLGYDEDEVYYDERGSELWKQKKELTGKRIVLYIGKIDENKNPMDIVKPFSQYQDLNPEYVLVFVGDANARYREKLEAEIERHNVRELTYILPAVKNSEMRFVFSAASMAIWPHGSSMAMIEAMACHCPVIASDHDVNRERLGQGRGVLIEENSSDSLFRSMSAVEEDRESIIKNAKEWVSNYSWNHIEQQTMQGLLKVRPK